MLQYLRIKNLALLQEVALDFQSGFTVVTGETGAGKSVFLGALSLLSGARADKTIIRENQDACEVEATLSFPKNSPIHSILQELGLAPCEEGSILLLRRTISRTKPGRIFINGSLATLLNLQEIGEHWIDFHGPGEPQKLFHQSRQLEMLDLFAQQQNTLTEYQTLYKDWRTQQKKIEALKNNDTLNEDEIEFYKSQIDQIDSLNPTEETIEELKYNYDRLSKIQEITSTARILEEAIQEEGGVLEKLQFVVNKSEALVNLDPRAKDLASRIRSLVIESEDIAQELSGFTSGDDTSDEYIQQIESDMMLWLEIQRKYGPTLALVLKKRQMLADKVDSQSNIEEKLKDLEEEENVIKQKLTKLAQTITLKRTETAKQLSKKAQTILSSLGFKKASLDIKVINTKTLTEVGNSTCEFLFSGNAGQAPLPLNKIASSGETARVMLAFKSVLAEVDQTPLLVFDEVDANIGGEIGSEVGKELSRLAENHQVFCITHLPQVAAQGKNHYLVTKDQTNDQTYITIASIHNQVTSRQEELARMLGDRKSKSALQHAEELLKI